MTELLLSVRMGTPGAKDRLFQIFYEQLRNLAHFQLGGRANGTLNPTALVHEAFLKLLKNERMDWRDRRHFLSVAALAMRQVVIDHARRLKTIRRQHRRSELDPNSIPSRNGPDAAADEVLLVDEAVTRLREQDPVLAELVNLHWFAGQSLETCAEVLQRSPRTIRRYWATACDWLRLHLQP